jgi:hypothetical protein
VRIVTPDRSLFDRSIREQRARTPTQRFLALCELLDVARAMVPRGPEARARRLRDGPTLQLLQTLKLPARRLRIVTEERFRC